VSIRAHHGTYIRAHPGGEGARIDLQTQIDPWEKFYIEDLGNSKFAFRTLVMEHIYVHILEVKVQELIYKHKLVNGEVSNYY
jgi:hypothetical protein